MGIVGLWSLLESIQEDVSMNECAGKRIAVDLSGWIVSFTAIPRSRGSVGASKSFLAIRGLFFRALNLSKLGIILVFVIDGPQAPPKKGKYNRKAFFQECQQYKSLLTAMGFLVLEAEGEAEKMCAELNMRKLVDGVLTSDGDSIIYGAQVVYKGISTERKDQKAAKFTSSLIESELGLNHKDLVAFALLSKGDINDGVPSVGEKTFLELHKEMKKNGIEDVLDRVVSWASNLELIDLENKSRSLLKMPKPSHCSLCGHEGAKNQHSVGGCALCKKETGCLSIKEMSDKMEEEHPFCLCNICQIQRAVKPYIHELKVRRLALEANTFPSKEVIDEFLSPCNKLPEFSQVCMKVPNYRVVCDILHEKLRFSQEEAAKHLIPWIIKMSVIGILPDMAVQPRKIIKSCTEQFEKCFTVKWAKLDCDDLSSENAKYYEFNLPSTLFASKYPEMCKQFEVTSSPKKGKRKRASDPTQRKLSDMFKVVKKGTFANQPSKG